MGIGSGLNLKELLTGECLKNLTQSKSLKTWKSGHFSTMTQLIKQRWVYAWE